MQNNGSKTDAANRAKQELSLWPYSWIEDSSYQSRGSVFGKLRLSDGRPAARAAIFLGDSGSNLTTLSQGQNYYYTAFADSEGRFSLGNVRSGTYALYAWSNGGNIGDVAGQFKLDDLVIDNNVETVVGQLTWKIPSRKRIFQIGSLDRKALGFGNAGFPYQHALANQSPQNLVYVVGKSKERDWYFSQASVGQWTINFRVDLSLAKRAILGISLAGYSKPARLKITLNARTIGSLSPSTVPGDPNLYRSSTIAGEWHYYEFSILRGTIVKGENKLILQIEETKPMRGFMWDSVLLDWE
jgi:rhamnogalacturonan endolyase